MALTVAWEPKKSYSIHINAIIPVMIVLGMTEITAQDVMKEIQQTLHQGIYMKEHARLYVQLELQTVRAIQMEHLERVKSVMMYVLLVYSDQQKKKKQLMIINSA